jgi:hypothetical protein
MSARSRGSPSATMSSNKRRIIQSAAMAVMLLASHVEASFVDCNNILVDGLSWNFKELTPGLIDVKLEESEQSYTNMTVKINVCGPLGKADSASLDTRADDPKKDDDKKETKDDCPNGTSICSVRRLHNIKDDVTEIIDVIPIAGDFLHENRELKPLWTRLKNSPSSGDEGKEGLRGEFHGGLKKTGPNLKQTRPQKAIIEFLCDTDRTGLEGLTPLEKGADSKRVMRRADEKDDKKDEAEKPSEGASLKLVSYRSDADDTMDILRLEWKTKFACEENGAGSSAHYGFFTWILIIFFLLTATYLIFGGWMNYSRNGARGWDLLPHSDTIRDLPYLFRDWGRKVIDTFSGGSGGIRLGSSRGGYAAV